MIAYNTYIPPILGGFQCSQAHDLLTCRQSDLKDKLSPIKKNEKVQHFDPNFRDCPLKLVLKLNITNDFNAKHA